MKQETAIPIRLDGFRARLKDIQALIVAIFGPLDIHRTTIMPFDLESPAGQGEYVLIRQHGAVAFC